MLQLEQRQTCLKSYQSYKMQLSEDLQLIKNT